MQKFRIVNQLNCSSSEKYKNKRFVRFFHANDILVSLGQSRPRYGISLPFSYKEARRPVEYTDCISAEG